MLLQVGVGGATSLTVNRY